MDKILIGPHIDLQAKTLISEPNFFLSEEQELNRNTNRANPFGLKIQTTVYTNVKHPSEGFSDQEDRSKEPMTIKNIENNPSIATQLRNHNSPSKHNEIP